MPLCGTGCSRKVCSGEGGGAHDSRVLVYTEVITRRVWPTRGGGDEPHPIPRRAAVGKRGLESAENSWRMPGSAWGIEERWPEGAGSPPPPVAATALPLLLAHPLQPPQDWPSGRAPPSCTWSSV